MAVQQDVHVGSQSGIGVDEDQGVGALEGEADFASRTRALEKFTGEKAAWHSFLSGFLGGVASLVTLPIDTMIARTQT